MTKKERLVSLSTDRRVEKRQELWLGPGRICEVVSKKLSSQVRVEMLCKRPPYTVVAYVQR